MLFKLVDYKSNLICVLQYKKVSANVPFSFGNVRGIHLVLEAAMGPPIHIITLLCGILGSVSATDFFLVAPSSLRLNSFETIGIATDGCAGHTTATVYIQDHPGKKKNITEKIVDVISGKPSLLKIRLEPQDLPSGFLTSPDSPKFVSLNARFLDVHKEILIPLNHQSGYVFIQTDKPIYTPQERVYIRIIPLDEDSLLSHGPLKLQIRNPNDNIVEQKEVSLDETNKAFVSVVYNLPSFPDLGEWSATVYYGHGHTQNSTVHFQLKEYVLPFFTVKLETPDFILITDETFTIKVSAKYSYGKKVKGFVSFRIGRKTASGQVLFKLTIPPRKLRDGSYEMTLKTENLWDGTFVPSPEVEGYRLYVEATVTDVATSNEEKVVDTKCIFTMNPFQVSFKRCLRDFKPGFISVVEGDISYKNGKPADRVPFRIVAVADQKKILKVVNPVAETDENGRISFEIQPEITDRTVTVRILEIDGGGVIGTVDLTASDNDTYISLAREHPQKLKPGIPFTRFIHTQPASIKSIYFLVVARGKILIFDKLPEGKYRNVQFSVTHEMVPNFRILILAEHGQKLLADSLKIEVENECHPDSKVSIDTLFEIKEPGYNGKIIVRGAKGTSVGLIGVDEAVYALSKKDVLTKAKVFERLASHDLGCGPGGGDSINAILGNAGITVATNSFSSPHSYSCMERKRRKRSFFAEMASAYTGFERRCCSLGMENDPNSRSCEDGKGIVENYLTEEEYANCSKVFMECCQYARRYAEENPQHFFEPDPYYIGDNHHVDMQFVDYEDLDEAEIRQDFEQTWFQSDVLIGPDRREEIGLTLPDSITTWVIHTVSVSPSHGVCVAEPIKLESTKKLFMHLNLPYSVVRNEQIEIPVTVFNYFYRPVGVTVYMYGAEGLCSGAVPGKRSEKKDIVVDALSSAMVTFPVIPLKAEVIRIIVNMVSNVGVDIVVKSLMVVPEGVVREITIPVRLDPTNQQRRKRSAIDVAPFLTDRIDPTQNIQLTAVELITPEDVVPGTESCTLSVIGDVCGQVVETAVKNPEDLMKMPGGCGEQNMMKLAPTLYISRYLKITGRLTAESEQKGYEYMKQGYAHQIGEFKKEDGSYAIFRDRNSSTWLTAFVIKVFCQASELIYVDEEVVCSGVRWLMNNQQADGSYVETGRVHAADLMGGLEGRAPMTAFVLIALEECKCEEQKLSLVKSRAVSYLENNLKALEKNPLSAAVIAYALALSDSEAKGIANNKLLSMATFEEGRNWLYWQTENSAHDIQTAGYALLTQLLFNDMDKSASIVNWLNTQQLKAGMYKSTQDTVVALQAMSEYAMRSQMPVMDLQTNITSSNDPLFHSSLLFNDQNALVLRNVKVNKVGGTLFIKTKGSGVGTLSVKLRYNVRDSEDVCKFDIKVNLADEGDEDIFRGLQNQLEYGNTGAKSTYKELRYKVELCVRYLGDRDAGMSIVEVEMFTGFWPCEEELEKRVKDMSQLIRKYEMTAKSIVFYLEKVPVTEDFCFSFHIIRKFIVGNTQMRAIKVYDYYNPDAKCLKFYKPGSKSPLLRTFCTDGVCQCAESGCPPNSPFREIRKLVPAGQMRDDRRQKLQQSFCDDYDYVWIGRLSGKILWIEDEGLLNISFFIKSVIKAGTEQTEDIEWETRTLIAHNNCSTSILYPGADYLVLGRDGQRYMNEHGDQRYMYLLDQSSVVYMWVPNVRRAADGELQRDLNFVTKKLKTEGCDYEV